MNIYLINLERSDERRRHMTAQLEKLAVNYTLVSAFDKNNLTEANLYDYVIPKRVEEYPKWLTPGAIACSISHCQVYKKIIESADEYACVLEDDIQLGTDFKLILDNIESSLNKEGVFLLYFHGETKTFLNSSRIAVIKDYALYRPTTTWGIWTTGCYIISRKTAQRLLEFNFPVYAASDSWGVFKEQYNLFDDLWALLPLCTGNAYFASEIGYSTSNKWAKKLESSKVFGKLIQLIRRIKFKKMKHYSIINN